MEGRCVRTSPVGSRKGGFLAFHVKISVVVPGYCAVLGQTGCNSGPVSLSQTVPNHEGRPFFLCGGALQIACTMKGGPFLLWVGRLGYIVYIGTESIAKTIVQAQRGMLFNSHSFWHTPLAGCGGGGSQWDFSEPLGANSELPLLSV